MFKENSEPDIYRNNLAEEIKNAPKEDRKEILEEAKENPEYWKARNKKIEGRQPEEEPINDSLGVFIKGKKILYHGSGTPGLKREGLKIWEDNRNTTGEGIYFTSQAKDAIGYARGRSGQGRGDSKGEKYPVVYECSIENMKLLDLRKDENVKKILPGWRKKLREEFNNPAIKYYAKTYISEALDAIDGGGVGSGNLQDAIHNFNQWFSDYVGSLGYDGLATLEGGEVGYVGEHDTYVIFDPEKVKIVKEQKIKKEDSIK